MSTRYFSIACFFIFLFQISKAQTEVNRSSLFQFAIKGEMIYSVSGKPIKNGIILVENGKIKSIGSADQISIPQGYNVLGAEVVTPGLIDARTLIGMSGILNIPVDQDQLEKSAPIQPELRAIDAYNSNESLVNYARDCGITTIHTGHGVGALVSGQTMIEIGRAHV